MQNAPQAKANSALEISSNNNDPDSSNSDDLTNDDSQSDSKDIAKRQLSYKLLPIISKDTRRFGAVLILGITVNISPRRSAAAPATIYRLIR